MKTDRELLELAAKAAGHHIYSKETFGKWIELYNPNLDGLICVDGAYRAWNPLTDDGDALRLAVKLKIDVNHSATIVVAEQVNPHDEGCVEPYNKNPYAATRRAIVRAAAAIGEAM